MPKTFTLSVAEILEGVFTPVQEFDQIEVQEGNEPYGTSYLGTPVFDVLEIQPGTYRRGDQQIQYPGFSLGTVIMNVSQSKNIVRTPIIGRAGTVKEYISQGDFEISIQGGIYSEDRKYPEQDVEEMVRVLNAPVSLEVSSRFLSLFGIQQIVVNNYQFIQKEGYETVQFFQIGALSDEPISLVINEDR